MIAITSRNELLIKIKNPWQPIHASEWRFVQVKAGYNINLGKMLHNETTSPEDIEVPYLKSQHVQWDKVILQDLPTMWASPWEIKMLRVRTGDLLVCEGGDVGRAGIVTGTPPENCIIQNALHLVSARHGNSTHFLRHLLQHASSLKWFDVLCNRATIAHFTVDKFSQMWIWLPPPEKQRQIADYLDRETTKIDALIAAKKRLLELLAEKRKALITHAVTRGLKADVPMQDSGIEFLGDIPAHWNIEHLKYHLFNIEQGWSPQSDNFPADLDEWGVLKVGAVNGWDFNSNENKRIPSELEIPLEYEIRAGDILVSRANTPELVGSASLVKEVRSKLILCDKLYRLIPQGNRLLPEYLVFYLRSSSSRFEFERDASGSSSSMQNISQGTLANLWIPIPPVEEQIQMVAHIKNKLSLIEKLETTTRQAIALLQERRTSLISAAVTGQLRIPN
jgi:type I restriction enzyme, S subunit